MPSCIFTDISRAVLILWVLALLSFTFVFISIRFCLVITCRERDDRVVFLCIILSCIFVTLLHGVLEQMLYLIVSITDLCLFFYINGTYNLHEYIIQNSKRTNNSEYDQEIPQSQTADNQN